MTLDEFREEFINDVAARREADGGFSETAFTQQAAEALESAGVVDHFELCSFRDIKGKYKFDGYAFDEVDNSLTVCVSEWSGDALQTVLSPKEARDLFSALTSFLQAIVSAKYLTFIDSGDSAFDFALTLIEHLPELKKIRALLLTDRTLSTKVKDWPEGSLAQVPMEFYIWDIARFHRAFESHSGLDEIEVSLSHLPGGGLLCLEAGLSGAKYQGYLAVLPASELSRIYQQFGSRLLEGNVRAFLSTKGKVNQGIRRTLLTNPSMFFAYNNGISCVATDVTLVGSPDNKRITSIMNLQIVNGGQTTASIATSERDDHAKGMDQIFVPMKLSIVEGELFSSLMKDISLYANSQNKVSDADLASNDPFQIRFEEMSRRILAPAVKGLQYNTRWYYERARGQYANEFYKLPPKQRDAQRLVFPKTQLVTKQDLARVVLCWSQQPYIVALGSQRMIMEFARLVKTIWDVDKTEFNDQYYKDRISELIVYRHFEAHISKQSWYIVGYKAIIAAYSISWLSQYLEMAKLHLDLDLIWRNQDVPQGLIDAMLAIGERLFEEMGRPRDGRAPNVTQLAKRQALWADLRRVPIPISLSKIPTADKSARRDGLIEAKAIRVLDDGIEAQRLVIGKGDMYWSRILEWLEKKGDVSMIDRVALNTARDPNRVPSEKQSLRLVALSELANQLGFLEPPP